MNTLINFKILVLSWFKDSESLAISSSQLNFHFTESRKILELSYIKEDLGDTTYIIILSKL